MVDRACCNGRRRSLHAPSLVTAASPGGRVDGSEPSTAMAEITGCPAKATNLRVGQGQEHVGQPGQRGRVRDLTHDREGVSSQVQLRPDVVARQLGADGDLAPPRRLPALGDGREAQVPRGAPSTFTCWTLPSAETFLALNTVPTARVTPGRLSTLRTWALDIGACPRNGPVAPPPTTHVSTRSCVTVRAASESNPLLIPVITNAIPNTSAVPNTAIAKRRRRHCKSRSADLSIHARLIPWFMTRTPPPG